MTYKNALRGPSFGGRKTVVIGDSIKDKNPALLKALGELVHFLKGAYTIVEDVGTTAEDMSVIHTVTPYVAGLSDSGSGDTSPATAWGVYCGIKSAVQNASILVIYEA